jgi:UDP-glucose 4-epimerase
LRILVVGGAGYIGSHVSQALLQRGHEVVAFDNLATGHRANVQGKVIFRHGDILLPDTLDAVCNEFQFDGLVHLAALKAAGESMLVPEKYSTHNINGSLNLIHAAVRHGIKQFVFSSSAAVYGEPAYLPIDEKHPTRPENYYGYTKLAIERDEIHVGDLAVAHAKALEYLQNKGENLIINLGSETGITVLEILKKAQEITGREIPHHFADRRAGDTASVVASAAFAKQVLGWQAKHSDVDTLVRTTWGAYQKHAAAGGTKP